MPGFFVPVIATHVVYQNVVYTVDQFFNLITAGANPFTNRAAYTPTLDGSLTGTGLVVTVNTSNCFRTVATTPEGDKIVFCEGQIDFGTSVAAGTPLKLSLPSGLSIASGGLIGFGCEARNGAGAANTAIGIISTNDASSVAVWKSPESTTWTVQASNTIRYNFWYNTGI